MSKADLWIGKCEEVLVGAALLIVSLLIFVNVILRYFFSAGIQWSDEAVRYLMILLTFVGTSICVRKGSHIGIDVVLTIVNEKVRRAMVLVTYLVGLGFSLMVVYFSYRLVMRDVSFPQLSPALQIPMWIPYLSIVLGFSLSALRYLQLLFKPRVVTSPVPGEIPGETL